MLFGRGFLGFYTVFATITMVFFLIDHIENRDSLLPLISLVYAISNSPTNTKVASTIIVVFSLCVIFLSILFFEILIISFSCFVKTSLHVLSNNGHESDTSISTVFSNSMKSVEELNYLMNEFNKLFGFLLFVRKAFSLLNVYLFIWCLVSYQKGTGVGLYFIVAVVHVGGCAILIPNLGAVYAEYQRFQRSWWPSADRLTKLQKYQLNFLKPLGFKPAQLYVIVPHTILTFFSVMTTHVIIILQIYYKN